MSDTNIKEIFGNRLKKARIEKGITQAELSKLTTLTASTISAYEKCQKVPNLSSVSELSKALGVSIDWLCGAEIKSDQNLLINSNQNIDFTTLARIIVFLGTTCRTDIKIVKNKNSYPDSYAATLKFEQDEIVEFIDGFIKLKKIYDDGVFSKELFDISVNGLIDKYKNLYIDVKSHVIGDREIDREFEEIFGKN